MTTIDSPLHLGEVVYLGHRGPMPVASIRPLLCANDEGGWSAEYTDNDRYFEFPNAGNVSWLNPHADASRGTLWEFRVEEQPTFVSTDMKRDRYMVAAQGLRQVYEVVSLASLDTSQRSAREILLQDGLDFGGLSIQRCWLQMAPSLWMLSDLESVPDRDGYLRVKLESSGITRWYSWDHDGELTLLNGARRRLLLPPHTAPSGHPQQLDWADDLTVLKRVLQQARSHDREFMESLGLSKKAIERLSQVIGESGAVNDPQLHEARVERAISYLNTLQCGADRTEAVRTVLASSPLAEEIESQKQAILEEERTKARDLAESEQKGLTAYSDQLQSKLDSLEKQIAERRKEQEELAVTLDAAVAEKVQKVMENPVSLLSNIALIRAVSEPSHHVRSSKEATPLMSASAACPLAEKHTARADTVKAVECSSLFRDVSPTAGKALHISFMCGAIPVLVGDRATDALVAYARAVTGGQLLSISVSSLWVDPSDYLSSAPSTSRMMD